MQEVAPIPGGRHAHYLFERTRKVTLIVEAGSNCRLGNRHVTFQQFTASKLDALTPNHLAHRAAIYTMELTSQRHWMDPHSAGNLGEGELFEIP